MQKTFWMVLVSAVLVWSPRAAAQPIGIGVKLGVTLTSAISSVQAASVPDAATFIVGPYIELRLPVGFSVEGEALYFPSLYSNAVGGGSVWQFPILAKYSLFSGGPVQPFVEAGPAYSHLSDVKTLPDLLHSSNYGLVVGGGRTIQLHKFRFSPEVRYDNIILTNVQSPFLRAR